MCMCIFLFITTLISSYFSEWPSHSALLAFAISEWPCSLSFTIISFYDSTVLFQKHNKDCFCLLFTRLAQTTPFATFPSEKVYAQATP